MFQWEKEHLVGVSTVPNMSPRISVSSVERLKKLFELFVIIKRDIIRRNGCIGETIGDRVRPTRTGTGSGPFLWTPCGHLADNLGRNFFRRVSRTLFKMPFHYRFWILWNMFLWMVLHHKGFVRY